MILENSSNLTSSEFNEYAKENREHLKDGYTVMGIIGAQSSGKSTLLNKLFACDFDVMKEEDGPKQTTRGIWAKVIPQDKIILLDIEGSDSRERWDEKDSFEKKTALFGLALSNVLIVNLWANDLGRMSASNYQILETLFEFNIQLALKQTVKKMIFVVRDWLEKKNIEYVRNLLVTDMRRLWDKVQKKNNQANLDFNQVFNFEIVTIRSLVYQQDDFEKDTLDFRQKLTSPDGLLKGLGEFNMPPEDLYLYASQTWNTISENKDLNLPDQRIILSNFRCGEVRESSLLEYRKKMTALKLESHNRPDFDISEDMNALMNTSLRFFEDNTSNYDKSVSMDIKRELSISLQADALELFKVQNDMSVKKRISELESRLNKAKLNSKIELQQLLKLAEEEKATTIKNYKIFVEKYNMDQSRVREFHQSFQDSLSNSFSRFFSSGLQTFCKRITRSYLKGVEEKIMNTYIDFTRESWEQLNTYLEGVSASFTEETGNLSEKYPDIKMIFTDEVIQEFHSEMISTITSRLKEKKQYIIDYMIEKFKRRFLYDENEQPRLWRHLSDEQIRELFRQARDLIAPSLQFMEKSLIMNFNNEIIFSVEDCLKWKGQFQDTSDASLQNVLDIKYGRNSLQQVPWWMWFVLAYFMHDNVLEWLRNPFFFLILFLLVGTAGYLYFTNKIDYVIYYYNLINKFYQSKMLEVTMKAAQNEANNSDSAASPAKPSNESIAEKKETNV